MGIEDRIAAFVKLGHYLNNLNAADFQALATAARNENTWFTEQSIREAFSGIGRYLKPEALKTWLSQWREKENPKIVALVMAGNIPLVGFHDLLAVLVTGHHAQVRLSSKDSVLMKHVIGKLIEFEPRFQSRISTQDLLKNFDAVIATGSDNSSRYFDYYFSKYPHIIRKNRSSCAILSGFESEQELTLLGKDVFTYFGLGCRNISKLYVPAGYEFGKLFESWAGYENVLLHHKYHNNYDYQKSILLVNRVPFLDNGFVLLQESDRLVSPIAVLYYEVYENWQQLLTLLSGQKDKIQCIVGNVPQASVKIGEAQSPNLDDYADQINVLKFLESL